MFVVYVYDCAIVNMFIKENLERLSYMLSESEFKLNVGKAVLNKIRIKKTK